MAFKRCTCSNTSRCEHPWWLDYKPKDHGRIKATVVEALGINPKSKTDADKLKPKFVEEIEAALREGRAPFTRIAAKTYGDLLPKFLKLIRKVEDIDHIESDQKRSIYRQLGEEFGALPMEKLDGKTGILTIEEWRDAKEDEGRGVVALNRLLAELRTTLNWGIIHGFLADCPFGKFKVTLRDETPRDRRLEAGEEDLLLEAASLMDDLLYYHSGKKMRERLLFALDSGARRGEMSRVQRADIDYAKGSVTFPGFKKMLVRDRKTGKQVFKDVRNTKSGKTRKVWFNDRMRMLLEPYRDTMPAYFVFGDQGAFVESFRTTWDTLNLMAHNKHYARNKTTGLDDAQRAELETINLHWHDLRHEAISRWAESGKFTSDELMSLAGHTNFKTTLRYIKAADGTLAKKMGAM